MTRHSEDVSFLGGGPLFDLQRGARHFRPTWSATTTAVAFVLVTWAPPFLMTAFQGPAVARSFLWDTSSHLRLLVAGPVAILAEPVIDQVLRRVVGQFVDAGIVRGEEVGRFATILRSGAGMRDSAFAEVAALGFTYALSLVQLQSPGLSWQIPAAWSSVSAVAWSWYAWVSRPLLQFLFVRWLWRIAIWTIFLWRTSRLRLELSAAHPDRAGGLGFLAQAYGSFGLVAFAFSDLWTAGWRDRVVQGASTIASLKVSIPIFLALSALVFMGPLLVFVPKLIRLRQESILEYDRLGIAYCKMFENRWIVPDAAPDESLLGTADLQSFADLQSTVRAVREMRPFPIDRAALVVLGLGTVLPMLPLLNLVVPLAELVKRALMPLL